ncbi:PadR family transcriptional regulator [Actinomadura litoris]|uniref:PadR family transcriptional regulator n=1 Tax=Actinomadura litoris TaxID=2678616 RepID=UPI001FA7747D|nr:PadR family transcriptional regulator [Actinomadura litoris]
MSRPLTPLALAVLRMLCDGPMHPYEMQQRIRDHAYDSAVKITHGSLYHTVERLTGAGLIEPLETSREGRRPERTVYAVTVAGRDAACDRLAELLAKPAQEFPLLGAGLAFLNLLSEREVEQRLRFRALALEAELAGHRTVNDSLLKRGLERYKLIDHEWTIARVRAELDFVRGLADDLEAGRLTWEDGADSTCCAPPGDHGGRHDDDNARYTEKGTS